MLEVVYSLTMWAGRKSSCRVNKQEDALNRRLHGQLAVDLKAAVLIKGCLWRITSYTRCRLWLAIVILLAPILRYAVGCSLSPQKLVSCSIDAATSSSWLNLTPIHCTEKSQSIMVNALSEAVTGFKWATLTFDFVPSDKAVSQVEQRLSAFN